MAISSKRAAVLLPSVLLLLFVAFRPSDAFAATRTISNTGGNYNAAGTWVEGVVPTSADDVVATGTSGPLTVNVASNAKTVNFTNYTNTLTMNAVLTVSGNVTLVSAMTIAGTSGLTVDTTSTLTSNTKAWPNNLTLAGLVQTYTLADDWTVGSFNSGTGGSGQITTVNGFSITISGSLGSGIGGGNNVSGTTNLILNGTGTWSSVGTTINNNLTINTAGTITISGTVGYGTGTFTYTAGTVVTTGSTMQFGKIANDLPTGITTWNNLTLFGTNTTYTIPANYTISGNLTVSGAPDTITLLGPLTVASLNVGRGGSGEITTINGFTLSVTGSLGSSTGGGNNVAGSTEIILIGTGTWSSVGTTITNNLTINTAGTITVSGAVAYRTGTLTYTAGTVVTTGSTLTIGAGGITTTINTTGINWNNVNFFTQNNVTTIVNGGTIFVGGNLSMQANSGAISGTATITLNGTGTWTQGNQANIAGHGFLNNITINTAGTITVSGAVECGNLTYVSGTVVTTSSTLNIGKAATINTPGIHWNDVVFLAGAVSYTLSSDLLVGGSLSVVTGNSTATLNGQTIFVSGSLSSPANTGSVTGTTAIVLNGTGTWSQGNQASAGNGYKVPITINTAGTITVSGDVSFGAATLTYVAGTVTTTGSNLYVAPSAVLNTVGINWNNVSFIGSGTPTYTLSSDLSVTGTLQCGSGAVSNFVYTINGNTIHSSGGLTAPGSNGNVITGTTAISLEGTGTWSTTSTNVFRNNLTINTAGTITVSGTVNYDTGTLTYTSGTVTTTGSTLAVAAATTLNTNGVAWNNVTLSGSSTDTLTSNLTINGALTISGATTFAGTGVLVFSGTSTLAGSSAMIIPTSLTLASGMARTYTGAITFSATSGTKTITSNGTALASAITFDGVGGTWQLGDALSTTGAVTLTNGTLDANGKDLTAASFTSANSNTRAVTLGNGTWTLTGTGIVWDTSTTTGLTVTPNSSVIKISDASATGKTFSGGGLTYATLRLTGAGTGIFTVAGSNTFTTFTLDTPPHTLKFTGGTTNTACTWNLSGTAGNVNTITSTNTTGYTLVSSCPGTSTLDYLNASYLTMSPVGSIPQGANFVDGGNNTGLAAAAGGRSCTGGLTVAVTIAGGSATAGDAKLFIDGSIIGRDYTYDLTCDTHRVTATLTPDYSVAFSASCASDGSVIIDGGLAKTCNVTFTSLTSPITPTPVPTPTPTPTPTPAPSGSTATPEEFNLHEGETISAPGSNDPDVYIINEAGYKRLFLNPIIFSFYGHLGGFSKVQPVTQPIRDAFVTSGLFRNCETNDASVYGVEVTGEDVGVLHHIAITGDEAVVQDPNFFKKVFCINTREFDWYPKGSDYISLSQVPVYAR